MGAVPWLVGYLVVGYVIQLVLYLNTAGEKNGGSWGWLLLNSFVIAVLWLPFAALIAAGFLLHRLLSEPAK